jgi:hypothetical protein
MSEPSLVLLERCADDDSIAERRRRNYLVLLESLQGFAIFDHLPTTLVRLGFPVRVSQRNLLRQRLFESVFPPLHWFLGRVVPRHLHDSHMLEAMIVTLLCDQRYDASDMQRMIECFLASAREFSALPGGRSPPSNS